MNKKQIMIISIFVVVLLSVVFFLTKGKSLEEQLEIVSQYDTYTMSCNMELLENDDLKSFQIDVVYQKEGEYYKVTIYDKSLNQSQVIVRNEEGVFVVTPSLNQTFQFQSEWPTSQPKPYIYVSLLEAIEEGSVDSIEDGYLVKQDITYENDDRVTSQEIYFDEELHPVLVQVYDQDGLEIIKVEITSFEENVSLEQDTFNPDVIVNDVTVSYVEQMESSLPLYPVTSLGASLVSQEISVIGDVTNHILQFSGETSFTVVQSVDMGASEVVTTQVYDEVVDLVDGIGFYSDNQLTMIQSGILCSVYSTELTKEEMMDVINSLQVSSIK
ncbi:LolA family protein [Tannockella kyphosi]|uniref:LolA family protein n=1 Tax=Tannockella kyphosi TaxID=2899121 RepID=UPI0020130525|nr:hypothetical protein [Tannockella kyphosi]